MSDVDDDYMCDDEEDYDLVSFFKLAFSPFSRYLSSNFHLVNSLIKYRFLKLSVKLNANK